MAAKGYDELALFLAVAREGSFTRAAVKLGVSQSAVSQAVRAFEKRLEVRLLNRTTRQVTLTDLGERLLDSLAKNFDEIDKAISLVKGQGAEIAGTIRLSAPDIAARTIIWPKVRPLLEQHPGLALELISERALVDIVGDRFDAGIRLGSQVEKDMVSIPIGPPTHMVVVGSPAYFSKHPLPRHPSDLHEHECIRMLMPSAQASLPWEFKKGEEEINIRAEGRFVFSSESMRMEAVLGGMGLAYMLEETARERIASGDLIPVLANWCGIFPGFHMYYPSRHQQSPAFKLLVEALMYRPPVSELPQR